MYCRGCLLPDSSRSVIKGNLEMAPPPPSSRFEQIPDSDDAQLELRHSLSPGVIPSMPCTSQRRSMALSRCSPPGLQPPASWERNSP